MSGRNGVQFTLLEGDTVDAIFRSPARIELRKRATKALVEGLVEWQRKTAPTANPDPVLQLILEINRDPRFNDGRWRDVVADHATAEVEAWLSRETIEAFFRVVNSLQVDRRDMWNERRQFWLSYLPFIKRAWLIAGSAAGPIAQREGVRYGSFGKGAARDHCGLLMQVDDLMILEMNKMGRAILWKPDSAPQNAFPEMYDEIKPYSRLRIRRHVSDREEWVKGAIGLFHTPPDRWQRKFADHIQRNTRHLVRPRGY